MDDGEPPPESILVELACDRQVIRQDHTDRNGAFSFQLGGSQIYSGTLMDASVGGLPHSGFDNPAAGRLGGVRLAGMGRFDLSTCEIRTGFLPGFTSDVLRLGLRSTFDSDVGTIVLHRRPGVQGTTVSLNTLVAPEKARKAYEKAKKELRKDKPKLSKAEKELRKAVELYPEFAAAWHLLGEIKFQEEQWDASREAFRKAIAADSDFMSPYFALAQIELREKQWQEASRLTQKLIELDPGQSFGHYFHAVAEFNLGNLEPTRKSLEIVDKNGDAGRYVWTGYMLGVIYSREGRLSESANQFQRFLETEDIDSVPQSVREQVSNQLKQWEDQGLISALRKESSEADPKTQNPQ